MTLLDTRNDYEVRLGSFHGAVPAGIDNFRDFPQAVARLPAGEFQGKVPRVVKLPVGDFCFATEPGRGRFLIRVTSDGKENAYRVRLRTPCFTNLSLFQEASQGMMLADALALMGSLDLVIPDIDR